MGKHEILLGLTTTPASDWRRKVEEMKKFGIKRIALFPTFLGIEDRKELYRSLEEIEGLEIPHVHLRNDMTMDEIDYFEKKFRSVVFNIHPMGTRFDFSEEFLKYAQKTYVENLIMIPTEKELGEYAGFCLDFSHWENNSRLQSKDYDETIIFRLKKFPVGCCHVSPIKEKAFIDKICPHGLQYDSHLLESMEELDYMRQYKKYLPEYISLELENSFARQLEVKAYLEKILEI